MLRLVALSPMLLSLASFAGEYPYPEPTPEPKQGGLRVCRITALIKDEGSYTTRREAETRCNYIRSIFKNAPCSVQKSKDGRTFKTAFKKEWSFEGKAYSVDDARWLSLEDYADFAISVGYTNSQFPHQLTFSQCDD
jgi:hypothetical protein